MYTVDELDDVIELSEIPAPEAGAPLPVIVATDGKLAVEYYVSPHSRCIRGLDVGVATHFAFVQFEYPSAHMFGPPNDEAFAGHPLAARGLCPYAVFEVKQSSWIRQLERMNRVHPYHKPERYARYRHFAFTFHDSIFECVAVGFSVKVGQQARLSGPPDFSTKLSDG